MKKLVIEFTPRQFEAMVSMIEDNATFLGGAEEDFCKRTRKNLKLVQKALNTNNINYILSY